MDNIITFEENNNEYDVLINDYEWGTISFDTDRNAWVLWATAPDGNYVGSEYFNSLEDTKATIKKELE